MQFRFSQVPRLVEFLDKMFFIQTPAQSNAEYRYSTKVSLSTSTVSLIHPPTEPLHSTNDECLRDVGR